MTTKWYRVNKEHPCSVCGRPDWDTYNPELNLACCMRIQSHRPAKNGGWLHPLSFTHERKKEIEQRPPDRPATLDVDATLKRWRGERSTDYVFLAGSLGVSVDSLKSLGVVRAPYYHTWAFPMSDGSGNHTGIRLRSDIGNKWSERGSKQGIFMPDTMPNGEPVLICEGPTDAAAALTLGFWAVGRPHCLGGFDYITVAFKRMSVKRAVIVADNDVAGLRGAMQIAEKMPVPTATIILPTKDLRAFLNAGGTHEDLQCIINQVVWRTPNNDYTTSRHIGSHIQP